MTIIESSVLSHEGNLTFQSAVFVQVISQAFNIDQNGDFIVNVYCEATSTTTARPVSLRVLLNGVEGARDDFQVPTAGVPHAFSTFRALSLVAGAYTLSLECKSTNAGDTVTVNRIRMYAMRH